MASASIGVAAPDSYALIQLRELNDTATCYGEEITALCAAIRALLNEHGPGGQPLAAIRTLVEMIDCKATHWQNDIDCAAERAEKAQ